MAKVLTDRGFLMFALVVRFDLLPGAGVAFDALVDETLAMIRAMEPGTLVYACHRVDAAPDARIFYELYADRAAFDAHEQGAHVRRFLADREQHLAAPPRVEFLELPERFQPAAAHERDGARG